MEERKRKSRPRPKHEFVHEAVDLWSWLMLVRRAELSPSTKYVAGWLATWASPDGGDIIVKEATVADAIGRKERMVSEHLAILRELGLIEALTHATPGNPVEYQLTFPGEGFARIQMRLGPKCERLTERPVGRTGKRRPVKNTGTRAQANDEEADTEDGAKDGTEDPDTGTRAHVNNPDTGTRARVNNSDTGTRAQVSNPEDPHPGATVPDDTGTRAHEHLHPGAKTPAPGCDQPIQDHLLPPPVPGSYLTPTSAEPDSEPEPDRAVDNSDEPLPVDDLEYARATRRLRAADRLEVDLALTKARTALEAERIPTDRRRLTVRAAQLLDERAAA